MALPFFYTERTGQPGTTVTLEESTSKHISQVLRMKIGEKIHITDGKGNKLTAAIHNYQKKDCIVAIEKSIFIEPWFPSISIAVSLLKNTSRFEWFLEKATETGINNIIPMICERTERTHFRHDRLKNIMVSAMLQSQQAWLPQLSEPVFFSSWVGQQQQALKCIAHCMEDRKQSVREISPLPAEALICIGPEGDFTPAEIDLALINQYIPVSLGETRLRAETAAIAAAILLRIR
ncbi:MAG TPA: RsmE family RNA methyltransferase [Agriterribacter sp.]|nr:RsmE family RNA methyltransferase [Agriterribacter sp.]